VINILDKKYESKLVKTKKSLVFIIKKISNHFKKL